MNLSLLSTAITALLALSNAEADSSERTLRRGKDMMAKLQNLIDNGCDTITCPAVSPSTAECTFEKPERPSLEGLTEAEIAQIKEDMQAKKEEKKEQILKCACCAGFALEDMIAARTEGEGGGSRPGGMSGEGSGGRPQGGGDMMAKLQNLIDNGCNSLTCPAVNPSAAECTFEKPEKPSLEGLSEAEIAQIKEDMQAKKEEKKEQILKCACCAGFALEDMVAARPEGEGGGSRPGRVGNLRQSVTVAESATEGAASASESADEDDSSADGSTSADP